MNSFFTNHNSEQLALERHLVTLVVTNYYPLITIIIWSRKNISQTKILFWEFKSYHFNELKETIGSSTSEHKMSANNRLALFQQAYFFPTKASSCKKRSGAGQITTLRARFNLLHINWVLMIWAINTACRRTQSDFSLKT